METCIYGEKDLNDCVKTQNRVYDLNSSTKIELADQKGQAHLKYTRYRQEKILVHSLPVLSIIVNFHAADVEHPIVNHLVFEINYPGSIYYGFDVLEFKSLYH